MEMAKRILAVKKKKKNYNKNSDRSEQGQLKGKYDESYSQLVVITPYCYREMNLHEWNCSSLHILEISA